MRRDRRDRNGYDIAWISVIVIGMFLFALIVTLGIDLALNRGTTLSDNSQIVIVSALGTIGSIAGGALGYWVGGTTERRKNPQPENTPDTDEVTGTDPGIGGGV